MIPSKFGKVVNGPGTMIENLKGVQAASNLAEQQLRQMAGGAQTYSLDQGKLAPAFSALSPTNTTGEMSGQQQRQIDALSPTNAAAPAAPTAEMSGLLPARRRPKFRNYDEWLSAMGVGPYTARGPRPPREFEP